MKAAKVYVPCLVIPSVCLTLLGGESTAARAEPAPAAAPELGTRDYYEQKVKGAYALCQGELISISGGGFSEVPAINRQLTPGLTRQGTTTPSSARWLEGRALQVLSQSLVVIGRPVTNALGVVAYTYSGVVALTYSPHVQSGDHLRILAVSDGTYQYQTASAKGTLKAYREVAEPTFDEYRKIYERDRQASDLEPIISVERAEAPVPALVRSAAVVPATSAPPSDARSYMERLRESKKQKEAQNERALKSLVARAELSVIEKQEDAQAAAGSIAQPPEPMSAPKPGTRDYYEQRIMGAYVFDGGEMIPLPGTLLHPTSMARMSTNTRPSAVRLEGCVLQVLSNELAVIGSPVTNTSGVVAYRRSGLIALSRARSVKTGDPFSRFAMADGLYRFQTATTNDTLRAYREVQEPTYEEYRHVYERAKAQVTDPEPIVCLERGTPASPQQRTLPPVFTPSRPYAYTVTNNTVTITRYGWPAGDITVTNLIDGLPVVAIGRGAFRYRGQITAVAIPESVTSIGPEAFMGCAGLLRVTIPASVSRIDESAFWDCRALESIHVSALNPVYSSSADGVLFNTEKTRLIRYPQGKKGGYTIPSRVTHIGAWSFRDCADLTDITIPQGVTDIEGGAFWNCTGLTSIAFPASVTRLDAWAFSGCGQLESITVDAANPAFCLGESGVMLNKERTKLVRYPSGRKGDYSTPASVKGFCGGAFEGSSGLTGVTLAEGTAIIEGGTFKNCWSLTNVVIPASVTRIYGEAFSHCYNLPVVTLPDKLVELHGFAFWDCTNLFSIVLPATLSRIDGSTFQGCVNLKEVTIRNGATRIGSHAFAWCGIPRLTIPASVSLVEACAFRGCKALCEVYFEGDAPSGATDNSVFCDGADKVVVFYRPGTKGWGKEFGGRPTKEWRP